MLKLKLLLLGHASLSDVVSAMVVHTVSITPS